MGHPTSKVNLRIIGGTFSFYPRSYQTWFIKNCFKACNEFDRRKSLAKSLFELQKENEKAKVRLVEISIETRPDFITKEEIKRLRKLGVTKVELGVQSIYDKILELNYRGHKVKETKIATRLLKDAGFKVSYQIMLNLVGSDFQKDFQMVKEIFKDPSFRPDFLKIYPLALVKEAPIYKLYKKGEYRPYTKEELIKLLKLIKKEIPYYVRIERVIRDIPISYIVEGGTKFSHLRQIVLKELEKEGEKCKCIRCREIREKYEGNEKLELFKEEYRACSGKEFFLSFETPDRKKLFSLLRLRIPSFYFERKKHFLSVLEGAALIREIHTYGIQLPISEKKEISPQHKGLGKRLIKEAEQIAKKFGLKKIAVIAGVGVRDYFRKLGYRLKETYMIKEL